MMIALSLASVKAQAADIGNGLFSEYFQYRNAEYAFSATTKRFEVANDTVDKIWKNTPYSTTTSKGKISYNQLSVTTMSTNTTLAKVKYVNKDRMAVRWSGGIKVSTTSTVRFRIRGNGGAYFLLRDSQTKLEADNWKDNFLGNLTASTGTILTSGSKKLLAEKYYPIVVEYMNYDGNANILLQWSFDGGTTWKNVPKNVLYSTTSQHRSVSIKTLNKARLAAVKRASTELQRKLDKNYLADALINEAQDTALDMLGPRTKRLIAIGTQVLTKEYTDSVAINLGKLFLGKVAIPFVKAYDFMQIFKETLLFVDQKLNSDQVRAIVYLTTRENSTNPESALPTGVGEFLVYAYFMNDSKFFNLTDFDRVVVDSWVLNCGRLAGTQDVYELQEFHLLMMTAILESYVFQYNLLTLVAK